MSDFTSITYREHSVLRSILTNHFAPLGGSIGFPDDHIDGYVWSDCIDDANEATKISGKALSGVVSSLVKKELAYASGVGRDAGVCLTKTGYEAAVDLGPYVAPESLETDRMVRNDSWEVTDSGGW